MAKNSKEKKLAGGRTKEEILALRKKMMQAPSATKKLEPAESDQTAQNQDSSLPVELMSRLAVGGKAEINKKDMLKLT